MNESITLYSVVSAVLSSGLVRYCCVCECVCVGVCVSVGEYECTCCYS